MAEYIEKEKVLRDWPLCDEPADAYQFIRNYPAADVRPVVFCKDCMHNQGTKTWIDHDITADCLNGHGYPPLDWFCADGVKREES